MNAILIDDEPLALDFLEHQLNKIGNIIVLGKFTNLDPNKESSLLMDAHIVFLDIEMPEISGLELAEKLLEINPTLEIVFVTAHDNYAVQAFELNALDYIVKPIQLERLQKTLERIKALNNNQKDSYLPISNQLQVQLCRELIFNINDKIELVHFRTTKSQELFLYLLQHAGKTIQKFELAELLWPDYDQEKAYSQLYTAIYHTRKSLSKWGNHFSIMNMSDGYILTLHNVKIDVKEWESSIQSAPTIHIENIEVYEKIMELYTGDYLGNYDYSWGESERYRLERLWLNTKYLIANCYLEHNVYEKAESWFMKISNYKPDEEAAQFSLMKLYADLGYGLLVDHQYHQLVEAFKALNVQISPHITNWYKEWKK